MESKPTTTEAADPPRLGAHRALVLDSSFRPVMAVGWQRAICLEIVGRVEVLEYYPVLIRSARARFALPAVVRLDRYVRVRQRVLPLSRKNVLARDGYSCVYCGSRPKTSELTLDHVIPRSRGGARSWTNIVTACTTCNRKKGSRTPAEARMVLVKPPRAPRGLPAGRATFDLRHAPAEWAPYL